MDWAAYAAVCVSALAWGPLMVDALNALGAALGHAIGRRAMACYENKIAYEAWKARACYRGLPCLYAPRPGQYQGLGYYLSKPPQPPSWEALGYWQD